MGKNVKGVFLNSFCNCSACHFDERSEEKSWATPKRFLEMTIENEQADIAPKACPEPKG
jgi:hypothetical protein